MRIKATLPGYRQIEKEVDSKKTVKDLKMALCTELDIEPSLTRLLLNGEIIPEKSRISKLKSFGGAIVVDYLWARHLIAWGTEGQRKIKMATVLLAGAGAIGNEVSKNLAMLGLGRLFVVDRDIVELSNVSRMIFFKRTDLGKNKAEILAQNVHERYPFVETSAYRGDLESMPLKIYLDSNVIVSGLDNIVSRIYLSQISRKYSIPLIDGGIMGLTARVQSYVSSDAACPICIFPPSQYSNIVGLRNPCDAPLEEQTVPSFSTSISLVSSIIAQEVIKIILGLEEYKKTKKWSDKSGEPLMPVLFMDLKNNRYTSMPLKKNQACFVCGKEGTTRSAASRFDLPLRNIPGGDNLEKAVRHVIGLQREKMTLFSETSAGERRIDGRSRNRLQKGDYIKVLVEDREADMNESICRLT
ncbi:MAG: ThiF family adenylyltransferase [Candidatus Bathyarchaeia archaeon]|jgi:molybdopterin/thiamine biosynthesis adenylyltransferase